MNMQFALGATCFCAFLSIATAGSLRMGRKITCTTNMPCKWAVCPWSIRNPIYIPDTDRCEYISNDFCYCPAGHVCTLTSDVRPRGSNTLMQFGYRCAPTDIWNFRQVAKRASPEIESDRRRLTDEDGASIV